VSFILVFAGWRAWSVGRFLFNLVWCLINSVYKRVGISFILVFAGMRARFINELVLVSFWCLQG